MKAVIQRVKYAKVINRKSKEKVEIKKGQLVLLGIAKEDDKEKAKKLAQKLLKLRIFPGKGKDINLSLLDVKGEILLVSQFTLLGDLESGNRPSFIKAEEPQKAKEIFEEVFKELEKVLKDKVKKGFFGEYMEVHLINDGPVTLVYEI